MRTMTAADLCDECDPPLTTWIVKHFPAAMPDEIALSERPCPNCRYKPPAERVVEAARDMQEPDGCRFDHHGYCQAHFWFHTDPPCPQKRLIDALAGLDR
jgi:hypothetical protein